MDMDIALVAASYFESVRHLQEGSKVVPWAGAFYTVTDGSLAVVRCAYGFATMHRQTSHLNRSIHIIQEVSHTINLEIFAVEMFSLSPKATKINIAKYFQP